MRSSIGAITFHAPTDEAWELTPAVVIAKV